MSALRALVEAATPGPWMAGSYYDTSFPAKLAFDVSQDSGDVVIARHMNPSDAILISLAPDLALKLADAVEALEEIQRLINEQAEADGLWFVAESVVEAYFQQELRRLHDAVEEALARIKEGSDE